MIAIIFFALSVGIASANNITFVDCANHEVSRVDVSDCSANPCIIHKGVDVTILVDFTSKEACKAVEIQLIAKIGELEIQVPGVNTDACNGHLKCPLAAKTNYTLNYSVSIPKLVPEIEADITAKLVCTDDSAILACGTVHGAIQD